MQSKPTFYLFFIFNIGLVQIESIRELFMIEFKPIELSDKPLFDKYFNLTDFNNSEKNFSNLFMWRKEYDYEYGIVDGFLCIRGKSRVTRDLFYHYPYGEGDVLKVIERLQDLEGRIIFKPVLNEMKESLEGLDYDIEEKRNSFDYIYTSDKLINLKGPKLRNKRRWVKKFKDNYDYTYESITGDNLEEAKEFTLNLIRDTNNDESEMIAMGEMFDNFLELGIKGCIIRVGGEVIGVSTGEELTEDTVIIHCERGDRSFEGIYNVINQDFVKNQWADYKYINREQDLGIEGLRQAKMTYRPDILLEKSCAKNY